MMARSPLLISGPRRKARVSPFRAHPWAGAAMIGGALAVALPIGVIIAVAFTDLDDSLAHLARTILPYALTDTALLLIGVGALSLVIGVSTAWTVTAYRFPGRDIFVWLLALPLALPTYLAAYLAVELMEPLGPLQRGFRAVTGFSSRADYWFPEPRNMAGAIIIMSLVLYPYIYVAARAMFSTQSASCIETARLLGTRGPLRLCWIAAAQARPGIIAGLTLVLLETLNDVGATEYLGVRTLTVTIYTTWLQRGSLSGAAQIALILLFAVILVLCVEARARGERGYAVSAKQSRRLSALKLTRGGAWLAFIICAVPVTLGFLLPLALLANEAFDMIRFGGLPRELLRDTVATIVFAAVASALAVATGVGVAIFRRSNPSPRTIAATRLAGLGYAIPGVALALGLLPVFALIDRGLDQTWRAFGGAPLGLVLIGSGAALTIALAVRFLAIAIGGVEAGLSRVSPHLDGAARTLGLPARLLWREVQWPLVRPALAAAALLVFIDAAKELPATLLLRPLGVETLATSLYGSAARGQFSEGAVHALLILLIGMAAALRLARAESRAGETRSNPPTPSSVIAGLDPRLSG